MTGFLNMVEREVIETSRHEAPNLQSGPLPLTELSLQKKNINNTVVTN